MTTKQLRTRAEKNLTPLAFIFSILVWAGAIYGTYSLVASPIPEMNPCIYEWESEHYYYDSVEEAEIYDDAESCLELEQIPEDVYENVVTTMEEEAQALKIATLSVPFIVFFYIGIILLFIYVSTALAMAYIRLNGLKISKLQYPKFYELYEKTAHELGLERVPDAYIIMADGALNAFAIKIAGKRMVVFYAELIEHLVEKGKLDELQAVAAHELTHVKLGHIYWWLLLLPFYILPFLGKMLFRAREYSADRGAYFICKDEAVVSQALVKLATGKTIAKEVNVEEYAKQPHTEWGFFIWLAEVIATHPPIPYRIQRIKKMARKN